MGPGAGIHGGKVVAVGTPDEIMRNPASLTGQYLTGLRQIPTPRTRRPGTGARLRVKGARANNLKSLTVDFPLGTMTCVTGVPGGGKSTLLLHTLYNAVALQIYGSRGAAGT